MTSVLIAYFNNSRFLVEAIESVFNQDMDNNLFSVSDRDDASTVESVDVFEKIEIKI
jgi:glycosyltransferase involved in cell wall biosynthesis